MGLRALLTGSDTRTGQQRRAASVRAADRAGRATMGAKTRRLTAVEVNPPSRGWWRSS